MEALKKKFKSRRGASILLALLFLLLCMMVAASVVMAAASNAGKIKSNKEEQQKYLTLSSAVTVLTDELNKVEYVGSYTYTKTPVYADKDGNALVDAKGNPTDKDVSGTLLVDSDGKTIDGNEENVLTDVNGYAVIHHYVHTYTQQLGTLTDGTWLDNGTDPPILPLRNDLDWIFKENFEVPENEQVSNDQYIFEDLEDLMDPEDYYTLEFAVGDEGYGSLSEDKVRMKVTLRSDGSILVEATLWEAAKDEDGKVLENDWKETAYTMEALLRPDPDEHSPEELLVLSGSPAEDNTIEIKWQLKYIFKKGAEPNAAPTPEDGE